MALSAPLLTRKRVIKVALESTKGDKVAGTQALLTFDLEINSTAPFEERKGAGLYRGQSQKGTLGELSGHCSFKVELRGNGSNGMEPGLAMLLQASGFVKSSETYTLHSDHANDKTLSIDVWEDGKKKGLAGASGNVTFDGEVGGRMFCNFEFDGIWQTPTDEALPAFVPSSTAPILLRGGVFTLATESIKISKFSLTPGCAVIARKDVDATSGIAYWMITDYDPVASLDPEADLVAGYDYHGVWLAGTEAALSLALNDGTDKITFTVPKLQYREIKEGDREGIQIYDITAQCNHDSGNDAISIAVAAA